MSNTQSTTRHVLILMGHTGGGHLRTAEAITEALRRRYGEAVKVEIIDAVGNYAPFPFNRLADFYPWWINYAAITWHWGYRLTDGRRRATVALRLFWPQVWLRARHMLRHHSADVIVSVHPLTNHHLVWALRRLGRTTPTLTLVTDPVSVHPFWLSPEIDRCLVGSAKARRKALLCGFSREKVRITGLPVNPSFVDGLTDKAQARRALGWALDRPAVLMVGGVDGMGRIYQMARVIDTTCSGIQMAVITGRNRRLRQRLEMTDWHLPTCIYGFVDHIREMPRLMSAADLLITKAGPSTLHEAFLAGLPLILNGAVPGHEEGNVEMVVKGGAGVWSPNVREAAALVARWTGATDDTLTRIAACSRALAQPHAAAIVADEIWQLILTPF